MKILLRCLLWASYPLVLLSTLLLGGLVLSAAWTVSFSVDNRTSETVIVTPLETFPRTGRSGPLPIHVSRYVSLPSFRDPRFELPPGTSVTVSYDPDDILFTSIVVQGGALRPRELLVESRAPNGYSGPKRDLFVLDNLELLRPARPESVQAAERAKGRGGCGWLILATIAVPWILHAGLRWSLRRVNAARDRAA